MPRELSVRIALLFCLALSAVRAELGDSVAKPIESYQQILAVLPEGLRSIRRSTQWTAAQREVANTQLRNAIAGKKIPVKMHVKVAEVANWDGMTLYSEITARDGCHVRVFGKFADSWKPKLTGLKKNETVTLNGVLGSTSYGDLWGEFTLSINVTGASFER